MQYSVCARCSQFPNEHTIAFTQYQQLSQIFNAVRVSHGEYVFNKSALAAYTPPVLYTGVNWNNMSDRPIPSVGLATVPTNPYSSLSSRHRSVTSSKPGAQTPGGKGVDIKHGSYARVLNRRKARGPLVRGSTFLLGTPIQFNPAFPVYGGKVTKPAIAYSQRCVCSGVSREN